jgi:ankyrin repeat protein
MAYPINDNPSYVIENSKETVIAEAIKKAIIKNIRNNNKDEITRLIAKYKIDINHQDIDGNTFLHHAIENRSKQAAEALLELNPDLSLKNNKNYTAEEYTQTKNNDDIRKILQHRRQRGALNNFVLQAIRDNNKSEVSKLIKEEILILTIKIMAETRFCIMQLWRDPIMDLQL